MEFAHHISNPRACCGKPIWPVLEDLSQLNTFRRLKQARTEIQSSGRDRNDFESPSTTRHLHGTGIMSLTRQAESSRSLRLRYLTITTSLEEPSRSSPYGRQTTKKEMRLHVRHDPAVRDVKPLRTKPLRHDQISPRRARWR